MRLLFPSPESNHMEDIHMLYNQSGAPDPTAYEALRNIEREKRTRYCRIFISSRHGIDPGKLSQILLRAHRDGFSPFSPVLAFSSLFDDVDTSHMGYAFLDSCHQLWVVGDPDRSVRKDIKRARHQGKPVRFFNIEGKEIGG